MKEDRQRCDEILKSAMIRIGDIVKNEREKKGWDIIELTIRSRVNQQTIYNIENKLDCNPTIKTLINLSDSLGINIIFIP